MKKNYIAPEAEILCFRPLEELAAEDLLGSGQGTGVEGTHDSDVLITW